MGAEIKALIIVAGDLGELGCGLQPGFLMLAAVEAVGKGIAHEGIGQKAI